MAIHNWGKVFDGAFHDFHHDWISVLKRTLNDEVLPESYYAMAEQVAGGLRPDVLALERVSGSSNTLDGGVAATAERPQTRFMFSTSAESLAQRRYQVVVRHRSDDAVVAIVEIVSPGNKASNRAIASFVDKSLELLKAGIHLLIIDLFPPGPRDPNGLHALIWAEIANDDFQLPADSPLTIATYCSSDRIESFVEVAAIGQALPSMPLFLRPEMHVTVPLARTYDVAFQGVPRKWRELLEANAS